MEIQSPPVLQNRLNKYFDSFREENINGVPFNIMPPKDKVPLIKQCNYNEEKDIFEIVFDYQANVRLNRKGNVIFIEDAQGRLVGIQVLGLREKSIATITLEVIATLDNFIKAARVSFTKKTDPEEIAKIDLEERKMDFFKDIIREEIPNLVKA
jgi:hypothetical protein